MLSWAKLATCWTTFPIMQFISSLNSTKRHAFTAPPTHPQHNSLYCSIVVIYTKMYKMSVKASHFAQFIRNTLLISTDFFFHSINKTANLKT